MKRKLSHLCGWSKAPIEAMTPEFFRITHGQCPGRFIDVLAGATYDCACDCHDASFVEVPG